MVLRYKVTLTGIKGFYRIYHLDGETSLYTFHKQLQADLEFPQDQLIVFKAFDAEGGVVARYGLFDLGSGTVDNVTAAETVAAGVVGFTYFYDVTNKKSVNIALEGEVTGVSVEVDFPVLVDSKGPEPLAFENGYVAYEDLPDELKKPARSKEDDPDDEDFDIDADEDEESEEDDDDEEGKEIYDGSESF